MKDGEYFSYERSTRQHARKVLFIALGFPVCVVAMAAYFGGSRYSQEELWTVAGVASLATVFLLVSSVIPNFRKDAVFRFVVNDTSVRCESPHTESYEVALTDIVGLIQVKSMAGRMSVEDFIETADGSLFKIPHDFDLNIYKVKKAIMAAKPGISRGSEVRY